MQTIQQKLDKAYASMYEELKPVEYYQCFIPAEYPDFVIGGIESYQQPSSNTPDRTRVTGYSADINAAPNREQFELELWFANGEWHSKIYWFQP